MTTVSETLLSQSRHAVNKIILIYEIFMQIFKKKKKNPLFGMHINVSENCMKMDDNYFLMVTVK